ncbi:hypothetical protein Bandiella_00597 [Candidatus Bandiella woodruffii]|uniref:Uncharacterized protein n=1 Tax=Candidatus Bandiella euplotis TaxID=1664265 RepID=A0ABZ0UML3_9RICK|nr:hypothetical protein Bandiella_00597 [Candidatus Bandiella woodruffii]
MPNLPTYLPFLANDPLSNPTYYLLYHAYVALNRFLLLIYLFFHIIPQIS